MQAQAQVGALEAGAVKEQIASAAPKISMADKERRRLTWAQVRDKPGCRNNLLHLYAIYYSFPYLLQITKSLLAGGVAGAV